MKKQARYFSTEIKQIDLDVNRTFRNHIMFMDRFGVKSVSPQEVLLRGRPCSICLSLSVTLDLQWSASHDSLSSKDTAHLDVRLQPHADTLWFQPRDTAPAHLLRKVVQAIKSTARAVLIQWPFTISVETLCSKEKNDNMRQHETFNLTSVVMYVLVL